MTEKHADARMIKRQIVDLMAEASDWLVLSHEKPDGDTVGSAVALTRVGKRLSKNVTLGCPNDFPEKYSFIYEDIGYKVLNSVPEDFQDAASIVICVDIASEARSVKGLSASGLNVINIDHHVDNARFGSLNWIDPGASSTGEMVAELILSSPWGIKKPEADALYLAMTTDNGRFSFASTSARSHSCAISLLEAGVSPSEIAEKLNSNIGKEALYLWGRAFSRVEVFSGGVAALMWLSDSDFKETGAAREDTENLVNYLLRIKGVKLCALLSETDRAVRVSLRARAPFNARLVAAGFGGGGHDLAAGCTLNESLERSVNVLRTAMEKYVEAGITAAE